MKIIREYVWDTLRRNKRTSLAIMTALFLMTTMMSCFSGFVYTMWTDSIALSVNENGNWHGELFDNTIKIMHPYPRYCSKEPGKPQSWRMKAEECT